MTVYSGTFAPAEGAPAQVTDPLAIAREKLREAARLPFHASRPNAWQESFRELISDARTAIRRHVWMASQPNSPMNRAEEAEPRLAAGIERQREEHEIFAEKIDELRAASVEPGPVDIWRMIELGEQAILLEMSLARHHNRLSQLLFESTHVDIGVAG